MSLDYGFCLGPDTTQYNSAQFSEAFLHLAGNGVCEYGTKFALTLIGGFNVYLGTGYAMVGGRWVKSDEQVNLTVSPAQSAGDRYDAIAAVAELPGKEIRLKILKGIDIAAVRENPALIRNDDSYAILLYLLRIRRGATSISEQDVTDLRNDTALCGRVTPLGKIATKALKVYAFLSGGIDEEVARIVGIANSAIEKGETALETLKTLIRQKTGNGIGDIVLSAQMPHPDEEWLLCDGGIVNPAYVELYAMLNGDLPNIQPADNRLKGYVYGGPPIWR